MDLLIKGIDINENKCIICRKEIYSDIIIEKSLLCQCCHRKISTITVDDFEYDYYKDKVKEWLCSKYNFK